MIKLIGPGTSTAASGKLADVLSFAKGKKGPYAKKKSTPRQPRSGPQLSTRALVKFLSQEWATISNSDQDSWLPRANRNNLAPYHAYLSSNCKRWTNFMMPSKADPATMAPYAPLTEFAHAYTKVASIRLRIRVTGAPMPWGFIACRSQTSGFTPGRDNVVALFPHEVWPFNYYLDTPLAPGWYYYRLMAFSQFGTPTPFGPQVGNQAT